MKSDRSIRNICIAAIKRHTIPPFNFLFSKIVEAQDELPGAFAALDGELPISITSVDNLHWTLVTTRRVVSCINGSITECEAKHIKSWFWGAFNASNREPVLFGELKLEGDDIHAVHIETGKASMITIYAIMTLVGQIKSSS